MEQKWESSFNKAKEDFLSAFGTVRFWLFETLLVAAFTVFVILWQPSWANEGSHMTFYQVLVPVAGAILGLFIVFFIFLFLAPYRQRNKARKLYQELRITLKPKLKVVESICAITSWGLKVKNDSGYEAKNCIGVLEYVGEVESIFPLQDMWGNHHLMWEDVGSIPGGGSIILRIANNKTKEIDGEFITSYYPAFDKSDSNLKPSFPFIDIIFVISLRSQDCKPLYNACYFYGVAKTPKNGVYSQKQLEVIAADLEQCPTIDECRKILTAHIARTQN